MVGLENRENHYPSMLSGGERQRTAIARSLANNPTILVADEPTGNLDSNSSKRIMELIWNLSNKNNMTMIIVTHDESFAKNGMRVLRIKDGCLQSDK